MERDRYLQEVEALVQHLSARADLLGDMDLYVIETLFEKGVPLETTLTGIRSGAKRLSRLKRPPKGLPLKRLRRDVERAAKKSAKNVLTTSGSEPASADDSWRDAVRGMAREAGPMAAELQELAEAANLGAERAFVRFLAISGEYYQRKLEAMGPSARDTLFDEIELVATDALKKMSPDARQDTVLELARRRLTEADPVLRPERFWQD